MNRKTLIFVLINIFFIGCIFGKKIEYYDETNKEFFVIYKKNNKGIYCSYLENDWEQVVRHASYNEFTKDKYFFYIASSSLGLWQSKIQEINIIFRSKDNVNISYSEIVCKYPGKKVMEDESFHQIGEFYEFVNTEEKISMIYFLYPKEVIEGHDVLYLDFQIKMIFEGEKIDFKTHKKISVKKEYLTFFDVWE